MTELDKKRLAKITADLAEIQKEEKEIMERKIAICKRHNKLFLELQKFWLRQK